MRSLILLAAVLAGCGQSASQPPDATPDATPQSPDAATTELPPGVFAFDGTDPTLPPADLAPLYAMIGDARYVGLGESIHTSGGYYALKQRLIEDLVANHGFRAFGMETPRGGGYLVNRYLETGQGTAFDALHNIFGVFADDHTEALFQWLRQWNQDHPSDPVVFFGFDEQQPVYDRSELELFLMEAAPADSAQLLARLVRCKVTNPVAGETYPSPSYQQCLTGLDANDAYVAAHRAAMVAAIGEEKVSTGELDLISLRAYQTQYFSQLQNDWPAALEARDIAMHVIFDRLRDLYAPTAKIVLWAHNYHLYMDHPDITNDFLDGIRTFGTDLHAEVGDAYAPIGFIGFDVGINWPGVQNSPPPTADSLEAKLQTLAQPYLIADVGSAWIGADTRYPVGGGGVDLVPSHEFRALMYLEHSPPMDALYW